jgi:hypothetical protein
MWSKIYQWMCDICVSVADWSSHPAAIILFPLGCIFYLHTGGAEGRLTLILSVLAISLTQMVLRAQKLETETNKLQMAELVKAIPGARDEVVQEGLTQVEIQALKEK